MLLDPTYLWPRSAWQHALDSLEGLPVPPSNSPASGVWWGSHNASRTARLTAELALSNGSDMVRTHSCVFLPSAAVIKKLHFHLFSHFCPLPPSPPGSIQHGSQISDRTLLAPGHLGTSRGRTRVTRIRRCRQPGLLTSVLPSSAAFTAAPAPLLTPPTTRFEESHLQGFPFCCWF